MSIYFLSVSPVNDDVSFSIGRSSGELSVSGTLDREALSRYFLTVDVSPTSKEGAIGWLRESFISHPSSSLP